MGAEPTVRRAELTVRRLGTDILIHLDHLVSEEAVLTITRFVDEVRSHYETHGDLLRVVFNSASWVETSLAMSLLEGAVPEKSLVTAVNIREAIKDLPRCPIRMAVQFSTLAQSWELERVQGGWERGFRDEGGEYSVVLLGEGNCCYDVIIRSEDATHMLTPLRNDDTFLHPEVVDLVMRHPTLLKNLVDLVHAMGLAFSPLIYFSMEDWGQDYARTIFSEVEGLFGTGEQPVVEPTRDVRWRAMDDTGIVYRGEHSETSEGIRWVG